MRTHAGTLLLLAASGFFQAAFALPIKHLRNWRWEQMWLAQAVTANVLFPLAWAAVVPAMFWDQASSLPWSHWVACYAWGLMWGFGGLAWGLALTRLGIAFANSFVFGVTVLTGALLPLAVSAVEQPPHPWLFVGGLVLSLSGTALAGVFRKHGAQKPLLPMPFSFLSYRAVLTLAIFAGLATAAYGLALTFGFGSIRHMVACGVSPVSAPLVVVLPLYLGSASVAIPAGLLVAARTGTLRLFLGRFAAWNWSLALAMGLCAMGTAVLYGFASSRAGHPSPNVTFGIFISFLVLGGVGLGCATGEMRGSRPGAKAGLFLSACGLVVGAWLLNVR